MPRRETPDPLLLILGHLIRRLRQQRGLSLCGLAATAGVSKGHLSNIEAGKVSITLMVALRLARVLGACPICSYLAEEPHRP